MDADAVRNKPPARSHPDQIRNAFLAAIVFELAVIAGGTMSLSGGLEVALVAGLLVTFLLGIFGLAGFVYYLATV